MYIKCKKITIIKLDAFGVCEYIKITDEEWKAMEDNFDDIEAPPGPYKLQPENQGEIKLHLGFFFAKLSYL